MKVLSKIWSGSTKKRVRIYREAEMTKSNRMLGCWGRLGALHMAGCDAEPAALTSQGVD